MDDLISRQQAIDTMQMFIDSLDKDSPAYKSLSVAFDRCIIELKKLTSAQPERVRGKWKIEHAPYMVGSKNLVVVVVCSNCGYVLQDYLSNFCPNCGADMREAIK